MTPGAMQHYPQSPTQRLGLASGIAFFGFLFASISASVYYPDDATPDQIAAWYAGNGGALSIPALLEGLALVSFLIFLVRRMAFLRERSAGRMHGMLLLGGALMVTTLRILAYSTDLAQVLIARAGGGY